MKTERILFTLSHNQIKLFETITVCKRATLKVVETLSKLTDIKEIQSSTSEKLIHEAAKLYEDNEKQENMIVSKIIKDYNLTDDEVDRLDINEITGVVRIIDKDYNKDILNKRFNKMWR